MKKNFNILTFFLFAGLLAAVSCGRPARGSEVTPSESDDATSVVYFTREITPESMSRPSPAETSTPPPDGSFRRRKTLRS